MDHFSESYGFGEYKSQAIKLLKTTLEILDEFDIKHMLISGTLLGYVRHNDFIPWDDDIDILVDESILTKKEAIAKKYGNINLFYTIKYDSIKICFSDLTFNFLLESSIGKNIILGVSRNIHL